MRPPEKWRVKVPGGVKDFDSFDMATQYQAKMRSQGKPFSYITRVAQTQNKASQVIADSINKVFKIESFNQLDNSKYTGSGFCVYPQHFVTCAHVLAEYNKNQINEATSTEWKRQVDNSNIYLTGNRQRKPSTLLAFDLSIDIAILQSEINTEPFILDKSANVGDDILAIGSPHGFDNNVSVGNLSALDRMVYNYVGAPKFMFFDVSVFEGNSGGPVILRSSGSVIGMVVLVVANNGEYGLNAGIDAETIKSFCTMNIDGFK